MILFLIFLNVFGFSIAFYGFSKNIVFSLGVDWFLIKSGDQGIMTNEAKVLLVMMYASGTKSLGLEGKGLNQFMKWSLEKMYSDNKENLKEYLLKIKDKFPNNELLFED